MVDSRYPSKASERRGSSEFGDAGDVFVGANLDYDSAVYQGG